MSSVGKNKKSSSSSKKKSASNKKQIDNSLLLNSPQLSTTQHKKETTKVVDQINLNNLFTQALERHKKDILEDKKNKLQEISHLSAMAEEYLSTFVLIGYSLQNEKVVVFNASNSKDEAALVDLLRATFIEIVNNRP
jgi:hypothetical protein